MMAGLCRVFQQSYSTAAKSFPRVCIVGSGPAGFYTAQQILKGHPDVMVDMYEKLPVPFGLARYGVAPDHPEVKNCINTFTQTALKDKFTFLGNVEVGQDITLEELRRAYHAVVLSYGAAEDRKLGIQGEELQNVVSARRFVGWYNGLPEDASLEVNLDVETVAVIGQGNVALDVARILLTPIDILKKTDIPEAVLSVLQGSRVKRVVVIGRRRPEHVAFTIKELREMINLPRCRPVLPREDFHHLRALIPDLPRPRKRLTELLAKTSLDPPSEKLAASWKTAEKEWSLKFLRSPVSIYADSSGKTVSQIELAVNRLEGNYGAEVAIPTASHEMLECGLILRSIGYKAVSIDAQLPFDTARGIVPTASGRVVGMPEIYASGWVNTGPVGVILSTMTNGFNVGKQLVADILSGYVDTTEEKQGNSMIKPLLEDRGVKCVSFRDWQKLDDIEMTKGEKLGKPREKVTDVKAMLDLMQ